MPNSLSGTAPNKLHYVTGHSDRLQPLCSTTDMGRSSNAHEHGWVNYDSVVLRG